MYRLLLIAASVPALAQTAAAAPNGTEYGVIGLAIAAVVAMWRRDESRQLRLDEQMAKRDADLRAAIDRNTDALETLTQAMLDRRGSA